MIALYNPVIPLDIPEGYFKIDGFDLDNPAYTDEKICENLKKEAESLFYSNQPIDGTNS